MQLYAESLTEYKRLKTREVSVGDLSLGNFQPIRVQTMTTTDTMDTVATVEQSIRCIQAGAELIRITAPSKKEAENLRPIKDELRKRGYNTPLVADIHFTPNAAEIAARIVEKVRINPGNYIDKKKFEFIEYDDAAYREEIERIRDRFTPLIRICKEYGTAMRIGTNHGSLSDRIMSRYGDTALGMVESAMEFLRVARSENYHQIVLSMKSSNPQVMVQAYRLLIRQMNEEFAECYPLHLGVTEAGDGEDGRIKSAIGIGSLLEDGIGDTIRVSLTEDPEFEIPVCRDLVRRYQASTSPEKPSRLNLPYSPFEYKRRISDPVLQIGGLHVPVVIADFSREKNISREVLKSIGYNYEVSLDKWLIGEAAADFIYVGNKKINFPLPGTLSVICDHEIVDEDYLPIIDETELPGFPQDVGKTLFVRIKLENLDNQKTIELIRNRKKLVLCLSSGASNGMQLVRNFIAELMESGIQYPLILEVESNHITIEEQLIHFSAEAGSLFLDGLGDGIWLRNHNPIESILNSKLNGRTYLPAGNNHQFLNNTSFSILQASRIRISKTEYISCPSCGRTLFELQETTARIRAVTNHLKGLKIAIMGCIVNGPGEMADADFGYVGSGPGKITLYRGKEIVKRNIPSEIAVQELLQLIKENEAWFEP
jgi:(E)-4-hydroxy-3-methylbut-2-enyl-diphosphate synthase